MPVLCENTSPDTWTVCIIDVDTIAHTCSSELNGYYHHLEKPCELSSTQRGFRERVGVSFKPHAKPGGAHFMSLELSKAKQNDGCGARRFLEIPLLALLVAFWRLESRLLLSASLG